MATRHSRVLAKYDWAKEHIKNLNSAILAFNQTNPHSIGRQLDAQTGELVYYVKSVSDVPDTLSFQLGDAIHSLRSTLDHLAYALVEASGGTPNGNTGFPIFDSAKAFEDKSGGKVPGLGDYALQALDNIQPYKGGWGHWAWELHRLDINDKHRALLTVCTMAVGRSMLPNEKSSFDRRESLVGPTGHFLRQMLFAASNPSVRAAEAGQILGRFPATEDYENVGFAFDVAINEPGIAEGMPTFLLLSTFSSEVLKTIGDLARFL